MNDWIDDVNAHEANCDLQFPQINSSITALKAVSHAHSTISGSDNKDFIKTKILNSESNLSTTMSINTTYHAYGSDTDGIVTWTGDLKEYVGRIDSSLNSHASTLSNHTTWLTNSSTYVQNVSTRLKGAITSIDQNIDEIDKIWEYIQNISSRLNNTNTSVGTAYTWLNNVSTYVQNVSSRVKTINDTVVTHGNWLGNVSTYVQNVSADLSNVSTRLATLITTGSSYDDTAVRGLISDLSTFAHSIKSCTCSNPNPNTAEYTPVFLSLS